MLRKEILENYRLEKKLTYEKLAKKLNVGKSTVYAYIKGTRNPSLTAIKQIALKTNLNLFDLLELSTKETRVLAILRNNSAICEYILENPKSALLEINKMIERKNNGNSMNDI